jgi:hypothetical protein
MDDTQLNGRAVCNLRGKDPKEDLNALADAIAQSPNIFILNDRLVWLHNGKLVPLSGNTLPEFIAANVVTLHLTNRATADNPNWQKIYTPFRPPLQWKPLSKSLPMRPVHCRSVQGDSRNTTRTPRGQCAKMPAPKLV